MVLLLPLVSDISFFTSVFHPQAAILRYSCCGFTSRLCYMIYYSSLKKKKKSSTNLLAGVHEVEFMSEHLPEEEIRGKFQVWSAWDFLMFQCALTCSSLLMSAGTPGKLQRALTCCSSLIKGSKRTFNFKGLFLKDSAYCKVATLKNKTIFAGPDFAVS